MTTGQIIAFFILSFLAFSGAIMMIAYQKVVHMVVSTTATFLSIAGLYILLEAEFVAIVQVMIYAGAISILMIFGIMMTKHQDEEKTEETTSVRGWVTFGSVIALLALLYMSIRNTVFTTVTDTIPPENNVKAIGELMFKDFSIPFEIISILLTVALIGAIALAKREERDSE